MNGRYILTPTGEVEKCDDLMTWAKWFEAESRQVADTRWEESDVRVSTVFLGLDHSFGGATPLLFETMIFGGSLGGEQERYPTRAEALKGHDEMVKRVEATEGSEARKGQNESPS